MTSASPTLRSSSLRALGVTATVVVTEPDRLPVARRCLADELAAIDAACSRFRDDSELSRLNRSAGTPWRVGPLLLEALQVALAAAAETDGLVDPTVGRSVRLAGYDATFRVVAARPGDTFRPRFERVPGRRSVELEPERQTVRIRAGVELDLGATAKALAADRAARAAAEAAGCGVLVGLGGDVAAAGTAPAGGWPVGLADDHTAPPDPRATVTIRSGGVATSSTTVRRWAGADGDLHHIIDPRSGRPAVTPWRTVTVAGATCVAANVAATAAIVLGDDAIAWLDSRGLPARLVAADGRVARTCGWPADGARAA